MNRTSRRVGYYEEVRIAPSAEEIIVFVHGLGGNYRKTWASLPDFICADRQFNQTDVYLFGYRSSFLRAFDPNLDALGQRLRTVLLTELSQYSSIKVIAHSLGGLVVREAIASVLIAGEAQKLRKVHRIIFCSTPHLGSVGALFAVLPGRHLWELRALRPKILDNFKIWQSRVNTSEPDSNDISHERYTWSVRVSNVWGLYDRVVSRANAFALPGQDAITIEGDHKSVVKPPNATHNVYVTLSKLLLCDPAAFAPATMACERIYTASKTLQDTELAISSTKDIPGKYEALCNRFTSMPGRGKR